MALAAVINPKTCPDLLTRMLDCVPSNRSPRNQPSIISFDLAILASLSLIAKGLEQKSNMRQSFLCSAAADAAALHKIKTSPTDGASGPKTRYRAGVAPAWVAWAAARPMSGVRQGCPSRGMTRPVSLLYSAMVSLWPVNVATII